MWVDQRSCQGDISFQPVDYNICQNPSDVFGVTVRIMHINIIILSQLYIAINTNYLKFIYNK